MGVRNGMNERIVSLALARRIRQGFGDPAGGGVYQTERGFYDFVIDGVPPYEVVDQHRDRISVIWTEPPIPVERARALRRLLAQEPGDASDGRVSLYNCPECGDLGCGAVTVRIDQTENEIWRDFGFENNYESKMDRASLSAVGPFHFDRRSYEAQLEALLPENMRF